MFPGLLCIIDVDWTPLRITFAWPDGYHNPAFLIE